MRLALSLLVLALLASACAAPSPPLYWHKTGATQHDFFRDDYECRRETTVTGVETTYTRPNVFQPGGALTSTPTQQVNQDMFLRCMGARG
jgi:hypothetical protein